MVITKEISRCSICDNENIEFLTGLDVIGRLTVDDKEYGYSYIGCNNCSIISRLYFITENNFYIDYVVSWNIEKIQDLLNQKSGTSLNPIKITK